jgi:hypothetical protein
MWQEVATSTILWFYSVPAENISEVPRSLRPFPFKFFKIFRLSVMLMSGAIALLAAL